LQDKNRKDRKKNKENIINLSQGIKEVDLDQEPDWDDGSSSTLVPEEVQERKQMWNGENRKAARDARKVAKNQTRFNVITKEEMESVQEALHPEMREAAERADQVPNGQGLADNDTIDQNITFNSHCFKYGSLRQGVRDKKIAKANDPRSPDPKSPEEERAILEPVLASLGVRSDVPKATKERKNLYARLRTAIAGDLEAFENEQAETMKRMAGYWRYVNRRTYNQMVRNNELWDWATGQKLPEVEEESDLESIQEEDESEPDLTDASTPATTPIGRSSPYNCYDADFDLPDGTPIKMGRFFGASDWVEEEEDPKTPTQSTFRRAQTDWEDDFDTTSGRLSNLHVPKLSINTGHYPNSTATYTIIPPSLENNKVEAIANGLRNPLDGPSIRHPKAPLARVMLHAQTPDTPSPTSAFEGTKDTRVGGQLAHDASPPKLQKCHREPKPFRDIGITIPPITTNVYGHLDRELPAPCEERKKQPHPLHRNVMNITIAAPKPMAAETGWQIKGMKGRAKKNVFPPMPVKGVAMKKVVAANVAAAKAGAGMNFAEMLRKGL